MTQAFTRIDGGPLDLLSRMLRHDPAGRPKIAEVEAHPWCTVENALIRAAMKEKTGLISVRKVTLQTQEWRDIFGVREASTELDMYSQPSSAKRPRLTAEEDEDAGASVSALSRTSRVARLIKLVKRGKPEDHGVSTCEVNILMLKIVAFSKLVKE